MRAPGRHRSAARSRIAILLPNGCASGSQPTRQPPVCPKADWPSIPGHRFEVIGRIRDMREHLTLAAPAAVDLALHGDVDEGDPDHVRVCGQAGRFGIVADLALA